MQLVFNSSLDFLLHNEQNPYTFSLFFIAVPNYIKQMLANRVHGIHFRVSSLYLISLRYFCHLVCFIN